MQVHPAFLVSVVAAVATIVEAMWSWVRMRVGVNVPLLVVVVFVLGTMGWIPSIYLRLIQPSSTFFSEYSLLRREASFLSWVLHLQLLHTALLWLRSPTLQWRCTPNGAATFISMGVAQISLSFWLVAVTGRWVGLPHLLAAPLLGFAATKAQHGRSMEPQFWYAARATNLVLLAAASALQAVLLALDAHCNDGTPSLALTPTIVVVGLHVAISLAWSFLTTPPWGPLGVHLVWLAPIGVHIWGTSLPWQIGVPKSTYGRLAFHGRSQQIRPASYPACVRLWIQNEERQFEVSPKTCQDSALGPFFPWFIATKVVADPHITIAQLLPHGRRFMESTTQPVMGVQIGFGPEGQRWNGVSMALSSECDAYVSWEDGRWLKSSQQSDDDYRDFCVRPPLQMTLREVYESFIATGVDRHLPFIDLRKPYPGEPRPWPDRDQQIDGPTPRDHQEIGG